MRAKLPTTPAGRWLAVFAAGFSVIAALLALTVCTPVPYGDLSRTGLLSESAFGWTLAQPEVPADALKDAPVGEAEVLVIGDSFSMTRRWQSVLVRDGRRVATMSWSQAGDALCGDLDAWLAASGFRGRLVVVESVERLLHTRLEASESCRQMKRPAWTSRPPPLHPAPAPTPGFAKNWGAQLMSGWRTWWNTRRAERAPGDLRMAADTLVRAVPEGCERFSHRLCGKALFFADDTGKGPLDAQDMARLEAITRATRTPLLWAVVPNKTSAYLEPGHSKDFSERLARSGLGPDLFSFAREQRLRVRDFYYPNDTHLSLHGELALGERLRVAVGERLQAPP